MFFPSAMENVNMKVAVLAIILLQLFQTNLSLKIVSNKKITTTASTFHHTRSTTVLQAEGSDGRDMEGLRGMKGYYRRPSRAIEKGGGFFVPGLEGERIRVISAGALILMIATNRAGVLIAPPTLIISELIAIISAVILFIQGLAAAFPSGPSQTTSMESSMFLSVLQSSETRTNSAKPNVLETVARAIVQTCEEVGYILVVSNSNNAVSLELGPVNGVATSTDISTKLVERFQSQSTNDMLFFSVDDPSTVSWLKETKLVLPRSAKSVAVIVDKTLNRTWIIAAEIPIDTFQQTQQWMKALIQVPA